MAEDYRVKNYKDAITNLDRRSLIQDLTHFSRQAEYFKTIGDPSEVDEGLAKAASDELNQRLAESARIFNETGVLTEVRDTQPSDRNSTGTGDS